MAGFSDDEARALLTSKLSDPSITPADTPSASQPLSLRDTLVNKLSGIRDPDAGLGSRIARNAYDLATDPAVLLGPGPALVKSATQAGLGAVGLGAPKTRDPISVVRNDDANAPPTQLRAQYAPDVVVNAAPTLDPKYTQVGRPVGGGAGGGGFGSLQAKLDAARKAQFGAMDEEKSLTSEQGINQAGRIMATSDLQEQEAARQRAAAEAQQRVDADTEQRHQAFLDKQQSMIDELGSMKVDPKRVFRNQDAGTQFSMWVGGILGGMLAGANGGSNTSLDRLDKIIDRDIKVQQDEIDNKKSAITSNDSLFGQMLKETGDQRLAAAATRNLMLESAKLSLQAKAAQLGIPEVRTAADLAVNGIDQKQKTLQTALAEQALKSAQQAAAAAESARQAAAQRAFENSLKVAELGLKKDALEVDRIKATGEGSDKTAAQLQALGKDLSDKDLAEGRANVDAIKQRLMVRDPKTGEMKVDPDKGLPGVGKMADLRDRLLPKGVNTLNPVMQAANAVAGLSDEERVSRGDWEKLKFAYQKQITGSGASPEERVALSAAFEGAKSPKEIAAAVEKADAYFAKREAAIKAGYDPRIVSVFEARRNGLNPEMPKSVEVKK